jgi:hypothetical protein
MERTTSLPVSEKPVIHVTDLFTSHLWISIRRYAVWPTSGLWRIRTLPFHIICDTVTFRSAGVSICLIVATANRIVLLCTHTILFYLLATFIWQRRFTTKHHTNYCSQDNGLHFKYSDLLKVPFIDRYSK